jgi:hypothetical protein
MVGTRFVAAASSSFVVVLASILAGSINAEEPAQAFLEGLVERGDYEMALAYLKQMEMSPLAPVEFRVAILYERGRLLIHRSHEERDFTQRAKLLDDARAALEQFVAENRSHQLALSARGPLGNLLFERAHLNIERANRKATTEQDKDVLLEDARRCFDEAHSVFTPLRDDLKAKLDRLPTGEINERDPNMKRLAGLRNQFRADYLRARLLIPKALEEKAETFSEGDMRRHDLLLQAADGYGEVYKVYRTRIAGLYARMYQGGCYAKLGNLTRP